MAIVGGSTIQNTNRFPKSNFIQATCLVKVPAMTSASVLGMSRGKIRGTIRGTMRGTIRGMIQYNSEDKQISQKQLHTSNTCYMLGEGTSHD